MFYHLVSRCVRRSFLCGKIGRRDFSHRRRWLQERIVHLARYFALEVHAYAIMSNHFHLVVYYDPTASAEWTDEEVVDRWLGVCPPRQKNGDIDSLRWVLRRQELLSDSKKLNQLRTSLGSQSTFMQLLKQPIARRANKEDGCEGHFFEQRFYSAALLNEDAILAAMAYVDLNPIRAKIAETLETSDFASIALRLRTEELGLPMRPVVSGLPKPKFVLRIKLSSYVALLDKGVAGRSTDKSKIWRERIALFRRKQRAFGSQRLLMAWTRDRNMEMCELPLPG